MPPEDTALEQEQQAPAAPDYIAEKFLTAENPVEAQARAYREAETEMLRIRTDADRERREFTEALQTLAEQNTQQPQPQQFGQVDPFIEEMGRAYEEGDTRKFISMQMQLQQAANQQFQQNLMQELGQQFQGVTEADRNQSLYLAEQQVQRQFGEERWAELAPKVQGLLSSQPLPPQASVEGYAAHLANLAKVADYDRLTQQTAALEAERTAKLSAQTLDAGGRVNLTAPANKEGWDEIKSADTGSWGNLIGS